MWEFPGKCQRCFFQLTLHFITHGTQHTVEQVQLLKGNLLRMYLYRISTRNGLVVITEEQQTAMVRNDDTNMPELSTKAPDDCVSGEKEKRSGSSEEILFDRQREPSS